MRYLYRSSYGRQLARQRRLSALIWGGFILCVFMAGIGSRVLFHAPSS